MSCGGMPGRMPMQPLGAPAPPPAAPQLVKRWRSLPRMTMTALGWRSEEHTSELQSHRDLHSFPTRRSSDLDADAAAGGAGAAARRPPAREAVAVLAAHDDDGARMADLKLVLDPEAAALTARPLAVGAQGKAAHEDRRLGLKHLDRYVAQKSDAHLGAGNAVAFGAGSGAAGDRIGDADAAGRAQFRGRDIADHQHSRAADRHLPRDRLGEG